MIRSKKEVMRSLLKRAFQENRGAEVILLIQWRKAVLYHEANAGIAEFERRFKVSEFKKKYTPTDSRCLDAFHFNAHIDGRQEWLVDNSKFRGNDKLRKLVEQSAIILNFPAIMQQREDNLKTNLRDVDWTSKFIPSARVLN